MIQIEKFAHGPAAIAGEFLDHHTRLRAATMEATEPMLTRIEIGSIAGIPIYLDMLFVLVAIVLCYPYFTSGSTQLMSAGLIIVAGLLVSILLHELGHAFAGRLLGAHVSHIELTGLGGVAHFERSLPRSALQRSVIYLAGPAVNLALWQGLGAAAGLSVDAGKSMLALPLAVLSTANLFLLIFNLLPAYPLDGGRTLDAWLGAIVGAVWSTRIVAVLGLIVAVGVALFALPSAFFLMLVALFLAQANWEALQSVGRWRR